MEVIMANIIIAGVIIFITCIVSAIINSKINK